MFKYDVYKVLHHLGLVSDRKYNQKEQKYSFKITKEYKAIAKSKLFDAKWYLKQNPDVKASGMDPVLHYLKYGWREGRNPSKDFDGTFYLLKYPDVKKARFCPLIHYEKYGKQEGRYFIHSKRKGTISAVKKETPSLWDRFVCKFKATYPKITIIVTSYNYQDYIKKTLDSLVSQTYQNIEIIVVDDGSKDGSVNVIKQYVNKFPFVYLYQHPRGVNKGLLASMQLGISHATGVYVAFCESDDYWSSTHLEEKIKIINSFADPRIIVNDVEVFGDKERCLFMEHKLNASIRKYYSHTIMSFSYNDFKLGNKIPTLSCCMIKRDDLLKCDLWSNPRPSATDWWLYRQLVSKKIPIYYVPKKLTFWRMHQSYNTTQKEDFLSKQELFDIQSDIVCHQPKTKSLLEKVKKIEKSSFFDSVWYKKKYNISHIDPAIHFTFYGWRLGYNPSPKFNIKKYLDNNPDVRKAGKNPLLHYLCCGIYEGRTGWCKAPKKKYLFPTEAKDISLPLLKNYTARSKRRIAIFAGFNVNGKISKDVVFYLKKLREICDGIVYVSDSPILYDEINKIRPLVISICCHRHGEYDFGSYKRGYQFCKEHNLLKDVEELVLCNDSCFGPFIPFPNIFNKMKQKACDFWGLTENPIPTPHIQSYFLVIRKSALNHPIMDKFMLSIKKLKNKKEIVSFYEIGLSKALQEIGFSSCSYFDNKVAQKSGLKILDLPLFYPIYLLKNGFPLLKKKCMLPTVYTGEKILFWPITIKRLRLNYPLRYIVAFLREQNISWFKLPFVLWKTRPIPAMPQIKNDIEPSYFDVDFYVQHYPEVLSFKGTPRQHYHSIGWKKGYNPSTFFNTTFYLDSNPDVKKAKVDPLEHFERMGKIEGRIPAPGNYNEHIKKFEQYVSSLSNQKRKILIISHSLSLTGAPLAMLNIARYLRTRDYNVTVVSLDNQNDLYSQFTFSGCKVFYGKDFNYIDDHIVNSIRSFDFIIANTVLTFRWVSQIKHYPYLWRIAEGVDIESHYKDIPGVLDVLSKADNVYAVSQYTQQVLSRYNPKVGLLLYGVEDKSALYVSKVNHSKLRFCVIGTYCQRKAQDLIMQAYNTLDKKYAREIEILFIGDRFDKFKNTSGLKFLGLKTGDEKYRLLASSDVLLCPSLDDPNPQVVMEGMMMHKPCVVSENVGQKDVITNGENGWIVKTGDVASLRKCFIDILSNKENLLKMGEKSYQIYQKYFTQQAFFHRVEQLVQSGILSKRSK